MKASEYQQHEAYTSTGLKQAPQPFTPEEFNQIQHALEQKLPPEAVAYRTNGQVSVAYLEGWRSFNYANEIFGFNGWSSEILGFAIDFMDNDGGKISIGISCTVRIYLKDGTFHDVLCTKVMNY